MKRSRNKMHKIPQKSLQRMNLKKVQPKFGHLAKIKRKKKWEKFSKIKKMLKI